MFPRLETGSAVVHSFDLLHGVQVLANATRPRHSLVLWFQESGRACAAGGEVLAAEELLRKSRDAGNAEGKFGWARLVASRYVGASKATADQAEIAEIKKVLVEAAETHVGAALLLADMHLRDGLLWTGDRGRSAFHWFVRAQVSFCDRGAPAPHPAADPRQGASRRLEELPRR